jgi:hypothetical protein
MPLLSPDQPSSHSQVPCHSFGAVLVTFATQETPLAPDW